MSPRDVTGDGKVSTRKILQCHRQIPPRRGVLGISDFYTIVNVLAVCAIVDDPHCIIGLGDSPQRGHRQSSAKLCPSTLQRHLDHGTQSDLFAKLLLDLILMVLRRRVVLPQVVRKQILGTLKLSMCGFSEEERWRPRQTNIGTPDANDHVALV